LGVLEGKSATSYPATRLDMTRCNYVEENVVEDGHIITSRGPGTAMDFAYALVERLKSTESADALRSAMVYS
jgi:Putative intracellular protease/amidase